MSADGIAGDVDLPYLASVTAGYTGADLKTLVNVAVVDALERVPDAGVSAAHDLFDACLCFGESVVCSNFN